MFTMKKLMLFVMILTATTLMSSSCNQSKSNIKHHEKDLSDQNDAFNELANKREELSEKRQYHLDQSKIFMDLDDMKEAGRQLDEADKITSEIEKLDKEFEKLNH